MVSPIHHPVTPNQADNASGQTQSTQARKERSRNKPQSRSRCRIQSN